MDRGEFLVSLTAGGLAGVCVDLILFPLDTVKTRLQSLQGFKKAGGFRGIYAGVPSAAVGSFPNAAAFFVTYEYTKSLLHTNGSPYLRPITHMLAASFGEVVACLIRVPSEVVKQRAQVSPSSSTLRILSNTLYEEGILGLYRGYKSTVIREIPFSLVQFPLWESLKARNPWRWFRISSSEIQPTASGFLVMEARTRGRFLAVCSLWSFCRWICSCSHHPSGCSQDKNYAGKDWLQKCKWECIISSAWSVEDTRDTRVVCRHCPSNVCHQSWRFYLSWDV
ncbi:S-adenosylmethionine mitochondrial carrier protein isoform X2 [Sceloporus undulatus]|uniref:S-adenosylmethionine mitochondrial carrier protein isoform X2 n=1 Tax=Sceloporus undulatus TaxID=8520 RepID=UPI001C4C72B1|nr:S-adenosylmethionine mitochondrial carrier protein isoform X2 [Sceloporus undulatus]